VVVISAVASDADGFGILPELLTRDTREPLFWWTDYHHVLAHNLLFAVIAAVIASLIASARNRVRVALLVFAAVHVHLIEDLVGSRGPDGYQWPIPYFAPFSGSPAFAWDGQWALNAWQNFVITIVLLAITFVLAWRRGYSLISLLSTRADAVFVDALRRRVPRGAKIDAL